MKSTWIGLPFNPAAVMLHSQHVHYHSRPIREVAPHSVDLDTSWMVCLSYGDRQGSKHIGSTGGKETHSVRFDSSETLPSTTRLIIYLMFLFWL